MKDFEFINFKPTPDDQYMLGIATIRLYGKVVLRYKMVKTKDGAGTFFAAGSYNVMENGEKKFISCFMLDSMADNELLMEEIRHHVNAATKPASVFTPSAGQQVYAKPDDQLPF